MSHFYKCVFLEFHSLGVRTAKAMVRVRVCAGSS